MSTDQTKRKRPPHQRRPEPEIAWHHSDRIEPGSYYAFSRSARVYRDRQFKRWVCDVQFDILDVALTNVLTQVTWYLNLGSGEKPRAGRRGGYWAAWVKVNSEQPKRTDRISS